MNKPLNPEAVAIDNTLKLLRRGKWEMEGEEVLAFYRVFEYWAKRLHDLNKPPLSISPVEQPIKAPAESAIPSEPKKSKKKK